MLRGSSLCAWLYTLVLVLLNGVVGGGLTALCYNSLATNNHQIGIVLKLCLGAGIVMLAFVLSWVLFIYWTWRTGSGQSSRDDCKGGKQNLVRSNTMAPILGMLSLIMLTISIMMDLSVTGVLWWTSHQLSATYEVIGNCFCVVGKDASKHVLNSMDVHCPEVEGFECSVVYDSVVVPIGSLKVFTKQCQGLAGGPQDPVCMEYTAFWNLFKVLRLVLPVLALVKLPVLLGNCSRWMCKENKMGQSQGKFATDSVSWIGLEVLVSPLKMVDPVQFYSDICTPVEHPLGERLGPVGQEHEREGSLQAKPREVERNKMLGVELISNSIKKTTAPLYGTVNEESFGEDKSVKDDSPPDTGRHTFSTPKNPRMQTPRFDLSKVVKPPKLDISVNTEVPDCRLNLKSTGNRVYRLSSFSSSHDVQIPSPPPLPKPGLSEFQSPSHPPPPFTRSATTLPKPVRINSDIVPVSPPTPSCTSQDMSEDHQSETSRSCISISRQRSQNIHSVQSSHPVFHSIREISEKARNRSNSAVDWTKLP